MYIANKVNGIGEILTSDASTTTVYFAETDKTSKMLTSLLPATYATIEEAENALNPQDSAETMEAIYATNKANDEHIASCSGASAWLSEKNRENAMNNRPSSMR